MSRLRALLPILPLLTACSSKDGDDGIVVVPDAGIERDAGETPPDGGEVLEPNLCDDLGLARRPFQDGASTFQFGDVAGDFVVNTVDGPWRFETEWTGCESYTFISYIPSSQSTAEEDLWASDPGTLVAAPINAHFFFLSWQGTEALRMTRAEEVKTRIDAAIDAATEDEEAREMQRRRFHYVLDPVFDIQGSVGAFLLDYNAYSADPASRVDLGDRGMAPSPPLHVFAIDRDQAWDAGGSLAQFVGGTPAFSMAGYLPLFFDHKATIRDAQAAESGVETFVLLEDTVTEREHIVDATLPADLSGFDTLEVDVTVNCRYRNPFACSEWDRIAHVFVCDDETCASKQELVRWITPYWRRGERRWVMDASPLMGLVEGGGRRWFQIVMGPTWERATERDVRVGLRLSNQGRGTRAFGAVRAFTGGTFDATYNTRDPFEFTPPSGATRVELVVILSGHGQADQTNCAEWCDHRHRFTVNGAAIDDIRHEGNIGSTAGCGPAAAHGVPPGQWGNWAPERAYWCPGLPVAPIVVDITDDVTLGQANTLTYAASYRASSPPAGGDISLTAYVVWAGPM